MSKVILKSIIGFGLCAMGLFIAGPLNASNNAPSVTQQRFAMVLMDNRCGLLDGPVRMALQAGFLQARNQEIYHGKTSEEISASLTEAKSEASTIKCDADVVRLEAKRVSSAFRQTQNIYHQTYKGPGSEWRLDRSEASEDKWRLVHFQTNPQARLGFGLFGPLNAPRFGVMIRFLADDLSQNSPYAASLLIRDPKIAPKGLILPPSDRLSTTPPFGFEFDRVQRFSASNKMHKAYPLQYHPRTNEFGVTLERGIVGVQPIDEATTFEFPSKAYLALAQLDPREDVVIEFLFQDSVHYARFKIGDFLVGLAGVYSV